MSGSTSAPAPGCRSRAHGSAGPGRPHRPSASAEPACFPSPVSTGKTSPPPAGSYECARSQPGFSVSNSLSSPGVKTGCSAGGSNPASAQGRMRVSVWTRAPCGLAEEGTPTRAMEWRDPGDVPPSGLSRKQGGDCGTEPPTRGAWSGHTETQSRGLFTRGREASPCLMGTEFHLGVKTSPAVGGGDNCTTV